MISDDNTHDVWSVDHGRELVTGNYLHVDSIMKSRLAKIIIVSIKCFSMDKLVFVFSLMNTTVK